MEGGGGIQLGGQKFYWGGGGGGGFRGGDQKFYWRVVGLPATGNLRRSDFDDLNLFQS